MTPAIEAIDIQAGDVLVVAGKEYPIRFAAVWAGMARQSRSLVRIANVPASTKRPPDLAGGTRGAPADYLAEVMITPLWPIDNEPAAAPMTKAPRSLLECFVRADPLLRLVLEDLK